MAAPLPPQGPGAEDAVPSAWEGTITDVGVEGVEMIIPRLSQDLVYGPASYASPSGIPMPGDPCVVVFTDGQPLAVVPGRQWGTEVVADVLGGGANDTGAVLDALAKLPPYSGGLGGGTVILPETATVDVGEIALDSGQRLKGPGMVSARLQGNGPGTVLSVVGDYCGLEDVTVKNTSANIAARALDVTGSNLSARRAFLQAECVGGLIGRVYGGLLAEFSHCKFGTSASSVCDVALLCDATGNMLRLIASSFTDAKSGAVVMNAAGLSVSTGCQFENFAGGGTYDAALALSGVGGGGIRDSYFEAMPGYGIVFFTAAGYSGGVEVGGNNMQTVGGGGGFINLTGARKCIVLPNSMQAGTSTGVVNNGTYAHTNRVDPQDRVDALGVERTTGLEVDGGRIERAGTGSPEGVLTAGPTSKWYRTDAPDSDHCEYFKGSGTGNTGWRRLTSTGHAAA